MPLDFPLWIRLTHVLNVLFLTLLARSGIEILGAHPKLYWNDDCRSGSAWLRLTRKRMPADRIWTSKDEEESLPSWLALPGRRNLGLGRHWHFATVILWVLTGIIYVVLLFATDEWRRLIPTSLSVFPDAWDTLLVYLHFNVPEQIGYNPLQQLSYFAVVFLLSPFMLLTGAAMSPAIAAQFPGYIRVFGGRQSARSLHFLSLITFAAFTVVHTAMVIAHDLPESWAKIVLGSQFANQSRAIVIGCIGLGIILAINVIATGVSHGAPRVAQRWLGLIVDPVQRALTGRATSRQRYPVTAISSYFRINGLPPVDPGYQVLAVSDFRDWRLDVGGLVRNPLCLSLTDLRAMPAQNQTTMHNCIQGWSAVAEWSGVSMRELLKRCEPLPEARYVVFHALDDKGQTDPDLGGVGHYYEVLDLDLAHEPQTLLAYEMNGNPLPIEHGAPLRLRVETQLGFKMVKYLRGIELVADYHRIGEGYGGWREDVQHYSRTVGI